MSLMKSDLFPVMSSYLRGGRLDGIGEGGVRVRKGGSKGMCGGVGGKGGAVWQTLTSASAYIVKHDRGETLHNLPQSKHNNEQSMAQSSHPPLRTTLFDFSPPYPPHRCPITDPLGCRRCCERRRRRMLASDKHKHNQHVQTAHMTCDIEPQVL